MNNKYVLLAINDNICINDPPYSTDLNEVLNKTMNYLHDNDYLNSFSIKIEIMSNRNKSFIYKITKEAGTNNYNIDLMLVNIVR